MMAGRLLEDPRAVLDPATFRVVGSKIQPPDMGERNRRGAHRTGLQCHMEIATGQPLHAESRSTGAQHQHLGMRRRIVVLLDLIAKGRDEGRVMVDGTVLTSPAVTVTADSQIRVDGKPLPQPERARLWRYHKPVGLVTTHRDEKGRPTVFGALPSDLPRLISIGRLDLNSEGLLLLTNDGALARRLELPATGWARRYKLRVHGFVDAARLAALARGITVAAVGYG